MRCALPAPTPAHHVKVVVKEWHGHISLRWDVEVAPGPQQRWRHVCNEGEAVAGVAAGSMLRYGQSGSWVVLPWAGAGAMRIASNESFGRDPLFGTRKVCQVLEATE